MKLKTNENNDTIKKTAETDRVSALVSSFIMNKFVFL